jgi:Cof subfamily protein (haloacid dehalogenase superfamily)
MKGWIALDIDGTITQDKYSVPSPVISFLKGAVQDGWNIALATGRAYCFASRALEKFDFPYVILPQNGSVAVSMPSQEILLHRYMKKSVIDELDLVYDGVASDFLVYSGYENRDLCYFRPNRFGVEDRMYLEQIQEREKEPWIAKDLFDIDFDIPLIKCFGKFDLMKKIGSRLLKTGRFQVSLIRDPFHPLYYILLVTDIKVSKGSSLRKLFTSLGRGDLVIAAGDDENDLSLLQIADIKIAMPHAPEVVRSAADFIAPPVSELGIIQALKIVMKNVDANRRT